MKNILSSANQSFVANDEFEYFSPKEACGVLRVGPTTLYALIKAKKLPARKLGRKTLIAKSDVRAFMATLPKIHGEQAA